MDIRFGAKVLINNTGRDARHRYAGALLRVELDQPGETDRYSNIVVSDKNMTYARPVMDQPGKFESATQGTDVTNYVGLNISWDGKGASYDAMHVSPPISTQQQVDEMTTLVRSLNLNPNDETVYLNGLYNQAKREGMKMDYTPRPLPPAPQPPTEPAEANYVMGPTGVIGLFRSVLGSLFKLG